MELNALVATGSSRVQGMNEHQHGLPSSRQLKISSNYVPACYPSHLAEITPFQNKIAKLFFADELVKNSTRVMLKRNGRGFTMPRMHDRSRDELHSVATDLPHP